MSKNKHFIIVTDGDRPISEIAKELAAAGLHGGKVMKEIGSVTGSASAEALAKLRRVRGVVDVSEDSPIDIGPPDADPS